MRRLALVTMLLVGCARAYGRADDPVVLPQQDAATPFDAGAESSVADPPTADGSSLEAAPGVETVLVDGFETAGCLPWQRVGVSANLTTPAHGGASACRICRTSTSQGWLVHGVALDGGGTLALETWTRTESQAAIFINLVAILPDGGSVGAPASPPVSATYTLTEISLEAPASSTRLEVGYFFNGLGSAGECFVIDDLIVRRVP